MMTPFNDFLYLRSTVQCTYYYARRIDVTNVQLNKSFELFDFFLYGKDLFLLKYFDL